MTNEVHKHNEQNIMDRLGLCTQVNETSKTRVKEYLYQYDQLGHNIAL